MSNILKSTKLDIALVKPYFKTICFTLLLPIVFAAINRSLLTGVSFAMCFIAMTTGYTFSITEKNSMDRLFGILPVRKSELVIGRYVFVLAMGLLSLIISLIAQPLVLKVLGETVGVFDIVTAAIAGVFLFALYLRVTRMQQGSRRTQRTRKQPQTMQRRQILRLNRKRARMGQIQSHRRQRTNRKTKSLFHREK